MEHLNKENNQKIFAKNISADDENIISEIFKDLSDMMVEDSNSGSLEEDNKTL